MKTSHQSPALLINEMSESGGQCRKNAGAGNAQVACEKYAAECTLDEGPHDTMSSQYVTGSTNINEPNMKVYPDDASSDCASRGMDPSEGCGKGTVKFAERHTDSNSTATKDNDDITQAMGNQRPESIETQMGAMQAITIKRRMVHRTQKTLQAARFLVTCRLKPRSPSPVKKPGAQHQSIVTGVVNRAYMGEGQKTTA